MPASQLKRLKTSLREQGITGPQKSKKERRKLAQDHDAKNERRLRRSTVLQNIREQLNPFDLKHNTRGPKFQVTTSKPQSRRHAIAGQPGVSRALGEERRRQVLLVEMQRRNKIGGIIDKRFGEDDPTMAPEAKMLERFSREKQRAHLKSAVFDLEDEDPMEGLTHEGKFLTFDQHESSLRDDFDDNDNGDKLPSDEWIHPQRRKAMEEVEDVNGSRDFDEEPPRKRSKREIMEEVIAKSKTHKYERQAAKDADEELREEVDKQLPQIQALLANSAPGHLGSTAAASEADPFDRDFDRRVRELVHDKRSRPTDRTRTEEEQLKIDSEQLKELEQARLRRMTGEVNDVEDGPDDEDLQDETSLVQKSGAPMIEAGKADVAMPTRNSIRGRPTATELGLDDEDDFWIEDNLIASGSELEDWDESESDNGSDSKPEAGLGNGLGRNLDEDEDGLGDHLLNEDAHSTGESSEPHHGGIGELPNSFPCCESLLELVEVSGHYPLERLPTIVQRIRVQYHPQLDSANKVRLGKFSQALVDFIARNVESSRRPSFSVMESLVRHIHSLAKTFPIEIGAQFRHHLMDINRTRPLALGAGDLILMTAIGSIFSASDHFHQIAKPAMLTLSRYLDQSIPKSTADYATGTYLCLVAIHYQRRSKRYVPELMTSCLNALLALAPIPPPLSVRLGEILVHDPPSSVRIYGARNTTVRRLRFSDTEPLQGLEGDLESADVESRVAIASTLIQILELAVDMWAEKASFVETVEPAVRVLNHFATGGGRASLPTDLLQLAQRTASKLRSTMVAARSSRRPLELHHHRPLAIRTAIPKFETDFDPNRHYDPDRERTELARLRAEHRRERKSVMRELRRDSAFMARENLQAKKTRDETYERKYRHLVAEIQGEEGREANAYDREKRARKRASARMR